MVIKMMEQMWLMNFKMSSNRKVQVYTQVFTVPLTKAFRISETPKGKFSPIDQIDPLITTPPNPSNNCHFLSDNHQTCCQMTVRCPTRHLSTPT